MSRKKITNDERERCMNRLLKIMTGHVGGGNKIGMGELYEQVAQERYQHRINDTKILRSIITDLRREGVPIMSSQSARDGGYWIAAAGSELDAYCKRLKQHALKKLVQVANLKKMALPDLMGQIRLEMETEMEPGGAEK